jgi:hypothetical protein
MSASTSPGRRVTPTWVGPGQHCEWRTGQGEVRPLRGAVVTELGDWRVEIDGALVSTVCGLLPHHPSGVAAAVTSTADARRAGFMAS